MSGRRSGARGSRRAGARACALLVRGDFESLCWRRTSLREEPAGWAPHATAMSRHMSRHTSRHMSRLKLVVGGVAILTHERDGVEAEGGAQIGGFDGEDDEGAPRTTAQLARRVATARSRARAGPARGRPARSDRAPRASRRWYGSRRSGARRRESREAARQPRALRRSAAAPSECVPSPPRRSGSGTAPRVRARNGVRVGLRGSRR
jgi:hypothetical protein